MGKSAKLEPVSDSAEPGSSILTGNAPRRDQTAVLSSVVERLCAAGNGQLAASFSGQGRAALPSRAAAVSIIEGLRSVLFPGYYGTSELTAASLRYHVGSTLDQLLRALQEQIRRGLCFSCEGEDPHRCADCETQAVETAQDFLERLPAIKRLLDTDVQAAYEGDPAATSPDETIFCYPGIQAITSYRIAHELFELDVPLIPRIITEHAHSETGIDIHPARRSVRPSSSTTALESWSARPVASATGCGSTRGSPSAPRACPSTSTASRSRGSTATRSWRTTR